MKKILLTFVLLTGLAVLPPCYAADGAVPLDAKLEYNQGVDYYKLGLYDKAIKSFREAVKIYPDYIDAYYNLATILDYTNQHSEALSVFKQILLRNPNDYESVFKAAQICAKIGDYNNVKAYVNIIPPVSEYYKPAQALVEKLTIKTDTPAPAANPQSNVAKTVGIYENIVSPTGITSDYAGNIYVATFTDNTILKITPDGRRLVYIKSPKLNGPISLASDSVGNIYVANYNANNILKVTPDGNVSVLLDGVSKPYGLHVNNDLLFISSQGSNSVVRHKIVR